jgi:hypothetical protein
MDAKPNRDAVAQVTNGRINGRFAPGHSGCPGGSLEAANQDELDSAECADGIGVISVVAPNAVG